MSFSELVNFSKMPWPNCSHSVAVMWADERYGVHFLVVEVLDESVGEVVQHRREFSAIRRILSPVLQQGSYPFRSLVHYFCWVSIRMIHSACGAARSSKRGPMFSSSPEWWWRRELSRKFRWAATDSERMVSPAGVRRTRSATMWKPRR
jgi:hypothetical protein